MFIPYSISHKPAAYFRNARDRFHDDYTDYKHLLYTYTCSYASASEEFSRSEQ